MPQTPHDPGLEQAEPEAGSGGGWRLPSGEDLISFALNVGLAAVPLAQLDGGAARGQAPEKAARKRARARQGGRGVKAAAGAGMDGKEVR